MTNDVTWVIDFRVGKENIVEYDSILSPNWCKIHHINELISGDFTEEKIKLYFDNYSYRDQIRDFWNDTVVKNPKKVNICIIADDTNIYDASLFSFYLKSNSLLFFNQIGLPPNSSLSCNLISYWDSSWSKEEESGKINNLYSLNLIQNIPDIKKRPFDFVYIFKDINSGIELFEYRNRNATKGYFNSKICALICHISNINQELIKKNDNLNRWCLSFGASLIYLDTETLYHKTAKELTNLVLTELISQENKPWEIAEDKPLNEKIKSLEFIEVFNSIKFQSSPQNNSNNSFYNIDLSVIWDWVGLSKLKNFFQNTLSQILFKFKESKVDYLFDTYNDMRSEIECNYLKVIDYKNSNIKTPQIIFEEYFSFKPFSFQTYRLGIDNLIKQVETQKKENAENHKRFYSNSAGEEGYCPCSMNPEVKQKYLEICNELNNKEGLLLNEKVENLLLKIKEKAENIPHPVSLLLKMFFLSTVIVLLSYIPLLNLFTNKQWLVYSLLGLLFIMPFGLMWNNFKNKSKALNDLLCEYEAVSKYYITRKLIDLIYRNIKAVYDDYINKCKTELKKNELKIKEANDYLKLNYENTSKYPDNLSVRSATSIAEIIPPIRISIDGNHFETKDLKGNSEKIYLYFKQTVTSSKTGLNDLLTNKIEEFNNKIINQLKNSSENISSSSDLLFTKDGVNIKKEDRDLLLNLLPPFNNGLSNIDSLSREVLLDSYRNDDNKLITDVFSESINTSVVRYNSNNDSEITSGSISVLNINQPTNNVFGLFSTSLGGNKSSFVEITEKFEKDCKDNFTNFLDKAIYETIVCNNIDTTDKREEVFSIVMKGFDLNFDENGWKTYFSDIESLEECYVKDFRKMFKEKFENILSQHLNSKGN